MRFTALVLMHIILTKPIKPEKHEMVLTHGVSAIFSTTFKAVKRMASIVSNELKSSKGYLSHEANHAIHERASQVRLESLGPINNYT